MHGFSELIRRAKAEGQVRADRWVEDLLLFIYLHEELIALPGEEGRAASRRLLALAASSISSQPPPLPDEVSANVDVLRRNLRHRLAGYPLGES